MTGAIDIFELTRELIDIPSVTGEEAQVGTFLRRLLKSLGYTVELQPVTSQRANVLATASGPPRVVLSTHMDTVPPHIASREDDEFIYGRGACDAKGIIAAQIVAAQRLRSTGVEDIGLLFTVDEEVTGEGAKAANAHPLAASCSFLINGEPTGNRLALGSKGSLQVTISTKGRAAHSAYPEQGKSAIDSLLDVVNDVRKIVWPSSQLFGETTSNIGVISGGTRPNVIPAEAQARLQLRLATDAAIVKQLIEQAVDGRAFLEFASVHDPQHMLAVDGIENTVVNFTTDIPYLTNWGQPLLIGPGSILDAHTLEECVAKSALLQAVDLYDELSRKLLARVNSEPNASVKGAQT
jgi:acetylornithine deacetylase